MGKNTEFPWELLKAECLRLVCTQLVQGSSQDMNNYPGGRKDEMIEFLRDVEARSLDAAVKTLELAPRKTAGGDEAASPSKRKAVHSEEDTNDEEGEGADGYNTRFKGIKRVKVREATPEPTSRTPRRMGRPRKSVPTGEGGKSPTQPKSSPQKSVGGSTPAGTVKRGRGRPRKSVPEGGAPAGTSAPAAAGEKPAEHAAGGEAKEGDATDAPVKRGRGRPRKSDVVAPKTPKTPKTPKAASVAKPPVLDADGNPKRGRGRPRKSVPETTDKPPSSKGKQVFDGVLLEKRKSTIDEAGATEPEAAAGGEAEEEDAVLAAVQNGNNGEGDLSSLGGSNKENDPNDAFRYTPTDHDVDMDADGDPDGEAVEPAAAAPATVV